MQDAGGLARALGRLARGLKIGIISRAFKRIKQRRRGRDCSIWLLGEQERADKKVGRAGYAARVRRRQQPRVGRLFGRDLFRPVAGHRVQRRQPDAEFVRVDREQFPLPRLIAPLERRPVHRGQTLARLLVVAGQGLERVRRNARVELFQIGDAQQSVAAHQVMVQERERPPRLETLQPERDLRQFHGHGVEVRAVDARRDHIAQRMPVVLRLDHARVGPHLRQFLGDPPRGGQQEMPRTAGRVDHREREKRVFGE